MLHAGNDNRWSTLASAVKNQNGPIPLNFAIPESFSGSSGNLSLVDPYTVVVAINPPLIIPDGCCADLITASFPWSQPNIAAASDGIQSIANGNDRVDISVGGGALASLVIATGLYSYTDVAYAWNEYAIANGIIPTNAASQNLFIFTGISATQQLAITVDPAALGPLGTPFPVGGIQLDFTNPSNVTGTNDSIAQILGFPSTGAGAVITFDVAGGQKTPVTIISPNPAGFSNTSAYNLFWSPVQMSYSNGIVGNLLYSFPLGGQNQTNSIINWQSSQRYPVQVTPNSVSSCKIWTSDQSGNKLPWKFYQAPFQFSVVISKNKLDGSI